MNWKFWSKKEQDATVEKQQEQTEQLIEEAGAVRSDINKLTEQITKLKRIQVKSSKLTEEKLDKFESLFTALNEQNERIASYEKQQNQMIQSMIRLLDELDHAASGIKESNDRWFQLLNQWSASVVKNLEEMGVYQLDVLGKTFNPAVAESVQAVEKDTLNISPVVPYQVVDVINRGFKYENERLLRKAKVVTVKEK